MGYLKIIIFSIFSLTFLFILSCFIYLNYWLNHSIIEKNKPIEYYVARGASFTKIIYDLSKLKIISHPKLFVLYTVFLKETNRIKYGTYEFSDTDTPKSILSKLVHGETIVIKITLPEGLNIYQVAQRFEKYYPTISQEKWLNFFSSESMVNLIGLNSPVKNLEGFLFPQTYFFDPHPEPQYIIKSIVTEFKKHVTQQMFDTAKKMGLNPIQYITLASIIEKETSIPLERNKVAAVYWNRIKKKMKLQADPTVIYGLLTLENSVQQKQSLLAQNHTLSRKDLTTHTLYNTYTLTGLPAGPIANPGIDSFIATLNPSKSDDLYFVATGQGGHVFSKTLKEHNHAVNKYIHFLREEKKKKKL